MLDNPRALKFGEPLIFYHLELAPMWEDVEYKWWELND